MGQRAYQRERRKGEVREREEGERGGEGGRQRRDWMSARGRKGKHYSHTYVAVQDSTSFTDWFLDGVFNYFL